MGSRSFRILAVLFVLQATFLSRGIEGAEDKAVRSVLDEYAKACESEDFDALSSIFSHDPDLVVMNASGPGLIVGWSNVAELYKSLFSETSDMKMRHKNVRIKMLAAGRVACLACDQRLSGTFRGNTFAVEDIRVTWVLEKQQDDWRIVHCHWSLLSRPDAEEE